MRGKTKSRRLKYGSVTVALSILVIASIMIVNVIFSVLAQRYGLYINMAGQSTYKLTENGKDYINEFILPCLEENDEDIRIIFCDAQENIEADVTQNYILNTAKEIQQIAPEKIKIEYLNVWENPKQAREYGVSASTDLVFVQGDKHTQAKLSDFYVFQGEDTTTPIAYNGEKRIATSMLRVLQEQTPMCYFTINHGETVEDYELMYMVADAGYNYSFLDLLNYEIPQDCDLLITYNPTQDFTVKGEASSISEIDKLSEYMDNGGKYMMFASADSFVSGGRENLENFLSEWGVEYDHFQGEDGIENCYNIKDTAKSLSQDGYTILAQVPNQGKGSEILKGITKPNVFGNTTSIHYSEGFEADGDGNYVSDVNGTQREIFPILVSHNTAQAWAGGKVVAKATDENFVLMSMTTQKCENGKEAYLIASGSIEYGSSDSLKSAVLGNNQTLTQLIKEMGQENAPTTLTFKPFGYTEIQSLTTVQARTITIILTIIPLLVSGILGVFILVRRKNA